jgi:hypothetical protein
MFLKNYTSDVPASTTINRIQNTLIKARVSQLAMDYDHEGSIKALLFSIQIEADKPPVQIRMPADVEGALEALWQDYLDGDRDEAVRNGSDRMASYKGRGTKKKARSEFRDQAHRTAWRLVQDWIEVQLSMVQMRQADFVQIFLPYVWDGKQTFYSRIKSGGYLALEA